MYSDPNCIFRDFFYYKLHFEGTESSYGIYCTYFFLLSYIKVSFAQCTMNM